MKNIEIMPSNSKIEALHKVSSANEKFLMHVHNNYEIYLSLSNNNKFFVGHKIYDANKNDVFLFNNTDIHKINVSDPSAYERYVVMFSPKIFSKTDADIYELLTYFDTSQNRNHKISLPDDVASDFLYILQKLIVCNNTESGNRYLKMHLYLIQLLLLINDVKKISSLHSSQIVDDDPRINNIMEYIKANCNYQITLDMLSKKFYLNKFYLCRMFKSKMGFGITNYIESCRLCNAIVLLREGFSVSAVALKTGFGSDTYFVSSFKKNLGVSPKRYLKEMTK